MSHIFDIFTVNGLPKNNATAKLWSLGAFATLPAKGDPLPASGSLITSVLTGPQNGCDGAYLFTNISSGDYVVSVDFAGGRSFHYHSVVTPVGSEVIDTQYPNPAYALAALSATSGGTLILTRMWDINRSASYQWVDATGGIHYGLLIQDNRINIIGTGDNSGFYAAASGVEVLTIQSTIGATVERSSRNVYEKFVIRNKADYAGCIGIKADRARRNRFRDLVIGHPNDTSGFVKAMWFDGAYIQDIEDCYIHKNDVGIDTYPYTPTALNAGPSHALNIRGGEIQANGIGVRLVDTQMSSIIGSVIEGNSIAGVVCSGVIGLSILGCYWENLTPADDVQLSAACRDIVIDGPRRVFAQTSRNVTILSFKELRDNQNGKLDINYTTNSDWRLINPWWTEDTTSSCRADIWTAVNSGLLKIVGGARPLSSTTAFPTDVVGQNLLYNPEMSNNGAGWAFTNMTVQSDTVPFGQHTAAATSGGAAASCSARCPVAYSFPTISQFARGYPATLSWRFLIPDSSWSANFQLIDGDLNHNGLIDKTLMNGQWQTLSLLLPIGSNANALSGRINFTVGSTGGIAYCAAPSLALGNVPVGPSIAPTLLPPRFCEGAFNQISGVSVSTGFQLDPLAARTYVIQGNGGPIATSGGVIFASSGQWQSGMRVTLVGASNTNYVLIISDSSKKIQTSGGATISLGLNKAVTFEYMTNTASWLAISQN